MSAIAKVDMPKACISCQLFCPKGYANDKHSVFEVKWYKPSPRTQIGQCSKKNKTVFATQLCKGYQQEPDTNVFDVKNRVNKACTK